MNRRELSRGFEEYRPRFQEAVDLMTVHVGYLLRRRGLLSPGELAHRVTGRVKSIESCTKKIRRIERKRRIQLKSWPQIQRHIDDVAGIRVVCNYLDELFVVFGHLQKQHAFREIRGKLEDYLEKPKVGYRALHTVVRIRTNYGPVKCEVQIRTALQDAWAVKSHALVYKLKKEELAKLPQPIKDMFEQQSDILYNMDAKARELADLVKRHLRGLRK